MTTILFFVDNFVVVFSFIIVVILNINTIITIILYYFRLLLLCCRCQLLSPLALHLTRPQLHPHRLLAVSYSHLDIGAVTLCFNIAFDAVAFTHFQQRIL